MAQGDRGPPPDKTHSPTPVVEKRQVAIAMGHDAAGPGAPRIVAKGHGEMAEKILRLAFENDVKVRSDPELAQVLSTVEVDCEIPLEAFAAVAEILSYVYVANRSLMREAGQIEEEDVE
jgi:flagellar biosynthesis protein